MSENNPEITRRGLLRGIGGLALLASGACSYTGRAIGERVPVQNALGAQFGEVTEKDYPTRIPIISAYGQNYFALQTNPRENSNLLPFALVPVEKARIEYQGDNRRVILKDEDVDAYFPMRVSVDGTPATEFAFRMEDLSVENNVVPGIKVDTSKLRKPGEFTGDSIELTESDLAQRIAKIKIGGQEYFYPYSETGDANNRLPIILIPYNEGITQLGYDIQTGQVTGRDKRGVYRPVNLEVIKNLPQPASTSQANSKTLEERTSPGSAIVVR
ncbi:MAG: hypothetical protein ABIH49_02625 [archaeon]